ncbi:3-dehydroquinate synthase [Caldicellulosiruptor naganoensis]|uniref:3-dehydroquinate synthase n=1 Tax=Caldicellulosiruptor naganoensis TaxID=29324 RepID=A0ABY7BDX9_9FIRM|nr:3-dehydroquinate synthase [Caldicellulosiruptor naganoensis]WAM30613.1 3-dehydroquinate synthase [Caldicellulosiruptor naganoensis]
MEKKVTLSLKTSEKDIPIFLAEELSKITEYINLCKYSDLVIFTDEGIYNLYKEFIESFKTPYVYIFKNGEESKSIESYLSAIDYLLENNIDRKALLVAIGGGVVGDVSGFIASTYKRGIRLINIPTTLLAMVDSSIGGKTGINFKLYKNQIGTFYQPEMIIICREFLKTLPRLELISGIGEVIKYGYTLNKEILQLVFDGSKSLDEIFQNEVLMHELILKSVKCKVSVVEKDEKESFLREVLNFGHTVGHAFESYYNFYYPHGIFVVFGMIAEMILSHLLFGFDFSYVNKLFEIIVKRNFLSLPKDFDINDIISIMKYDKKNIKDKIRMVLLTDVEKYQLGIEVEEDVIKEGLSIFRRLTFS